MSGAKEKKKIGLTTQIFIALIVGAILGIVLHVAASDVEFVQNVWTHPKKQADRASYLSKVKSKNKNNY